MREDFRTPYARGIHFPSAWRVLVDSLATHLPNLRSPVFPFDLPSFLLQPLPQLNPINQQLTNNQPPSNHPSQLSKMASYQSVLETTILSNFRQFGSWKKPEWDAERVRAWRRKYHDSSRNNSETRDRSAEWHLWNADHLIWRNLCKYIQRPSNKHHLTFSSRIRDSVPRKRSGILPISRATACVQCQQSYHRFSVSHSSFHPSPSPLRRATTSISGVRRSTAADRHALAACDFARIQ